MGRVVRTACPWILLWIGIVVPRAYLALRTEVLTEPTYEVERAASSLARQGYLGDPYPGYHAPAAHAAPLYPTVLSLVYALFGDGKTGHEVATGSTILIFGIGISLLPHLSRAVYGSLSAGWLAAGLMCVLPLSLRSVQISGQWEQHCTFAAVIAYLPLLIAFRRGAWRTTWAVAATGFATGLCILLSPQFVAIFGFFSLFEFVFNPDRWSIARRLLTAGAITCTVLAPWTIRNYKELGGWCFVRSNAGLELALGNNPWATGHTYFANPEGTTKADGAFGRLHPQRNPAHVERIRRVGELEYMRQRATEAKAWIVEHPRRFAELTLQRIRLFWFPPKWMWQSELSKSRSPLRWAPPVLYCGMTLLSLLGLIRLARIRRGAFAVLTAALLGLSIPYYFTHVEIRYIFPVHGIVLLLNSDVVLWILRRSFRSGVIEND
ncbi:MAG TPA: hypothetical protein VGJ05_15485 [Fimbriiglobus sp.]